MMIDELEQPICHEKAQKGQKKSKIKMKK